MTRFRYEHKEQSTKSDRKNSPATNTIDGIAPLTDKEGTTSTETNNYTQNSHSSTEYHYNQQQQSTITVDISEVDRMVNDFQRRQWEKFGFVPKPDWQDPFEIFD